MDLISVAGVLLKLIPSAWKYLQEESKLVSSAEKELDNIKVFIEESRDFLEKAYSKEVTDKKLRRSIERVRNFLYDVEDAIEDRQQRESEYHWEGLVPDGDHLLDSRTFTVKLRDTTERLRNYLDNLQKIGSLYAFHQLPTNHVQSSSVGHQSSSIAFFEERGALVGIEGPISQLVRWLNEDSLTSKVIFVHGAQGVGKSSLVGAVLRTETMKSRFDYYVWIEDLRSYELRKDCPEALMKANAMMWNSTKGDNQVDQVELGEAFRQMKNNNHRWALVLDDVGSARVFESEPLRSHTDQAQLSVIITTRISSLESFFTTSSDSSGAQPCDARPKPPKKSYHYHRYKHVFLSSEDSFALFSRKMFPDGRCPPQLEEASRSILEKSEGLPLAILATCKHLRDEQGIVTGTLDGDGWKQLSGKLGEKLLSKVDTGGPIGRMITLRMDYLFNIRACLFYLSIFLLDHPIRCSTMMRLWMAERFIEHDPIKKKAEETLQKLLDHNVIREQEKTSYGRVNNCRVHNLSHQIIISMSKDEGSAMIVANPEETLPDKVWHLSFHCDMKRDYKGTWVRQLRSLLVFKSVHQKSMKKLLGQAKKLKVLDLQRHFSGEASLDSFPEEILHSKYLRYLSLRDTDVTKIKNIGGLVNLETLDLKGTKVSKLPDDILKLKLLRHLLAYRSNKSPARSTSRNCGVKAPSAIGDLTSLQNLCMIKLKSSKWWKKPWNKTEFLEKLGKLGNLRRLGISMLRSEDVGLLCSSIEKLTNLVALHLIADENQTLDLSKIDGRKKLECLERVHLTGPLATWPGWILSPTILVKLVLNGSQLNRDQFHYLGELQSLKHMELQQAFEEVSEMTFGASGFQRLCFLGLNKFGNLASINVEDGALPGLERLYLGQCNSLTALPQFIIKPRQLKCLEIYNMPKKFMEAVEKHEVSNRINVKVWKDKAAENVPKLPQSSQRSFQAPPDCEK